MAQARTRSPRRIPPRPGPRRPGSHPAPDEQLDLARRARAGDKSARAAMILRNVHLAAALARQFAGSGMDPDDLLQEAITGLITAVDRFDPDRGFQFSTYAVHWIRRALIAAIERHPAIRAPRCRGGDGGRDERPHVVSLDTPVGRDGDATLADILPHPSSPERHIEDRIAQDILAEGIARILAVLSQRELDVIRARFGFDGRPLTLREIARDLGLSHERVGQIYARAISRLRRAAALIRLQDTLAELD